MPWETYQNAIEQALALAAGVEQVRLPDARRAFNRAQRLHVEYELAPLGDEGAVDLDLGDEGLLAAVIQNLEITARIHALSQSHAPDVSAYELAWKLITRAYLPEVQAILQAAGLSLTAIERAVPGPVPLIDDRHISAVTLGWRLLANVCEEEDQPPGPRDYFDRVEIEDEDRQRPPRAIVEGLRVPEELLDAADWRSLWLGTQTDLLGGRRWAASDDVAHNQEPGATVGSGVLTRASVISTAASTSEASDRDAGVFREDLALVLVVRGPAPAARARLLSRLASGGGSGWALDALADGSLELQAPAAALTLTVPGVLDGSSWVTVVVAQTGGTLSMRVVGAVASVAAPDTYADVALVLGANEGTDAPAGVELALVGEADSDAPAALLAAVEDALGL